MTPSFPLVFMTVAASVFAWLTTVALRRWASHLGLVDIPSQRSSHVKPTPRGGGLSFVVAALVVTTIATLWLGIAVMPGILALMLGSLLVAGVSLADDRWRLPARFRFGAHTVGALILIAGCGWVREINLPRGVVWSLGWAGLPLTFVWIVGLTNAYNFMDGIDGLAAGQAVIVAVAIAWLGQVWGATPLVLAMAILAGSVLGFLLHNWPPAKIFMGDVGSAFLGFSFAGWAVLASNAPSNRLPFAAWPVLLAPFLFDTGITLISRIVRGQRWYEAHREHFYQRLIRRGWSHLAVTGLYLGIAIFIGLVAIAYYGYSAIDGFVFLGLILMPLAGLVVLVWRVEV